MKYLIVFTLSLLGILTVGCAGEGYAAPKPDVTSIGLAGQQRDDCNQIMGTPFRSVEERHWFEENCSKWPPTKFETLATVRGKTDSPECAAMRGKPYASAADRQWFQTNCTGAGSANQDPAVFASTPNSSCSPAAVPLPANNVNGDVRAGSQQQQWQSQTQICVAIGGSTKPDRTDCNAIRGTSYSSAAEQAWYQQNCGAQPMPGQVQPTAPQQLAPQYRLCNPANPSQPNARGRTTPPC
jgi:hypothetical protein